MERKRVMDQESALFKELSQGRDLTELLKIKLENLDTPELCDPIIHNIISIYDKAISMLNFRNSGPEDTDQSIQGVNKRRKTTERWTKQVRVSAVTGQCEFNDGSSWRKYGQKSILGAKFPRSYYRCTHRHGQGCLATKQVQRSDEDPFLFLISYSGKHSCVASTQPTNYIFDFENKIPNQFPNLRTNKTEEEMGSQQVATTIIDNPPRTTTSFLDNFECEISEFGLVADAYFHQVLDCDHEIVSAQASTTNSPIGKSDFSFDQLEFISDLPFDTSQFFS